MGGADLSSQSPVVLCRSSYSPSLSLRSQGHGHGSGHYPAATERPRNGSHQLPQPALQAHRTRPEGKAHSSQRSDPPKNDSLRTSNRAFTSRFKEDDHAADEPGVDEAIKILTKYYH